MEQHIRAVTKAVAENSSNNPACNDATNEQFVAVKGTLLPAACLIDNAPRPLWTPA